MATEIFKCVAGSRLFGTNLPGSDTDYKAVHIPDARSILLGDGGGVRTQTTGSADSFNNAEDVDMTSFSLKKFLHCLAKMETNAIEMLFAPNMHGNDYIMNLILDNRFKVLSKNKKSFTGYAKGQAMRYAVRGDRVEALTALVEFFEGLDQRFAVSKQDYSALNDIEHVKVFDKPQPGGMMIPHVEAFGRQISLTIKPKEAANIYRKPLEEAGKRTRQAAENGGADWKGLYHSMRIVDEGLDLFSKGELRFPCPRAMHYIAIRQGELPMEEVLDEFEGKIAELEALEPISDFREKPDNSWIDELLYSVHEQVVLGAYERWQAS